MFDTKFKNWKWYYKMFAILVVVWALLAAHNIITGQTIGERFGIDSLPENIEQFENRPGV